MEDVLKRADVRSLSLHLSKVVDMASYKGERGVTIEQLLSMEDVLERADVRLMCLLPACV